MDDKRELNDILVGGEEYKTRQSKKLILLIIGIVVLILACVIIAISMTSKNNETIVVGESENVDPALPTGSFNNVPVENDEDKFEQIVREIKAKQQNEGSQSAQTPVAPITPTQEPKVTMPDRKEVVASSKPTITTSNPQTTREQQTSVYRGNNGNIAERGYYLQVGAFSKTPNKDFLDKINKYSYRIQEIMINSKVITRYLIGPYASRDAAQRDYNNVVRDIATPVHLQVE